VDDGLAAGRRDLLGDRFGGLRILNRVDDDIGAVRRQRQRRRAANVAGRSGDKGGLPLQAARFLLGDFGVLSL
jgi:hypothetical protein